MITSKKDVLLLLTEQWADWEASFAIANINSCEKYTVKTIATDSLSKTSIGGMRIEIDYIIKEYNNLDNLAMIILPGGYGWKEGVNKDIVDFIKTVSDAHIPVAAICGATIFLGKHGFLDNIKHTGDEFELFKDEAGTGYNGHAFFQPSQVVVDNGFITANETASVEFAYELYKILEIDEPSEIEWWYDNFKNGAVRQ